MEIAQLVKDAGLVTLGQGMNSDTTIRISCAAIHFPAMYNLQGHQRPVPLILVWEVKDPSSL